CRALDRGSPVSGEASKLTDTNDRSLMKSLRALGAFLICGCADLRDVFVPYHVRQRDIEKLTQLPQPSGVLDAALLLGCPAERDGSPSPCQRCRVDAAVREYQRGRVRYLIVSGGAAHTPAVEADVMGDLAEELGVPRERVVRERHALSTWQNARYSLALVRA